MEKIALLRPDQSRVQPQQTPLSSSVPPLPPTCHPDSPQSDSFIMKTDVAQTGLGELAASDFYGGRER